MAKQDQNVIDLKAHRSKPKVDDRPAWCITDLPFAKGGRGYWNVSPTGDYEKDGKTGREYAFAFMDFEHRKPGPLQGSGIPEIGIIVDMIAAGQDNEIVRNFFFTLTECSVAAWSPDRLAACRSYYVERDAKYAESCATRKREEHERRSTAAKKAAATRRSKQRGAV